MAEALLTLFLRCKSFMQLEDDDVSEFVVQFYSDLETGLLKALAGTFGEELNSICGAGNAGVFIVHDVSDFENSLDFIWGMNWIQT